MPAKNLSSLAFLLLVFVLISLIAYLVPIFANDYRYMLIEGTNLRAQTISDVFLSQYRHYFEWGGRTVNHVIAMLLLLLDKLPRALIQGLAFVSLLVLMSIHATGSFKAKDFLKFTHLFLACALLWLCLRYFGEVIFSTVSSANYLYSTLILLLFLLPWRFYLANESAKKSLVFALLMFFFGIIAGWTNENTGFALNFILGLYFLYLLFIKRTFILWQFTSLVGSSVGFLLLVLSPGNKARMQFMEDNGFDYFAHLGIALEIFCLTLLCFHAIFLCLIFLSYKLKRLDLLDLIDQRCKGAFLFATMGLSSLVIMIFSPNFPARTSTFCCVSLIIVVLALKDLLEEKEVVYLNPKVSFALTLLFTFFFALTYTNTFMAARQAREDQIVRDLEIKTALEQGQKDIVVTPFHVQTFKYLYLADIRSNPNYFSNLILKRFYGIEGSIKRSCDPKTAWFNNDFRYTTKVGEEICNLRSFHG